MATFKSTGDASKDMGNLLLQGWAMLEETCDGKSVSIYYLMLLRLQHSIDAQSCQRFLDMCSMLKGLSQKGCPNL